MDSIPLLDHGTSASRLWLCGQHFPFVEEDLHPWLPNLSAINNGQVVNRSGRPSIYEELETKPLLRVWDTFSGSIPDPSSGNRMLARLPRGELATTEARKTSLELHANHKNWVHTPYISFTSSPRAAVELVHERIGRDRGDQNIIVIDPWYRLQSGLPILDMAKEAGDYGVEGIYRENYSINHYLCLWEVTPVEVVGTWSWDDLRQDDNWYENIIMPAFRRHRIAR